MTRIEYHPYFVKQFETATNEEALPEEILGEIMALITALERDGHDIEHESQDAPSHPFMISRFRVYALRRTPATIATPHALTPPVIRIPYVWCWDSAIGEEFALVLLLGDKTGLGRTWYNKAKIKIENELIPEWERTHTNQRAIPKHGGA